MLVVERALMKINTIKIISRILFDEIIPLKLLFCKHVGINKKLLLYKNAFWGFANPTRLELRNVGFESCNVILRELILFSWSAGYNVNQLLQRLALCLLVPVKRRGYLLVNIKLN